VPTPNQRLKLIEGLAKANIGGVTLRLRPFLIGISDPRHTELIKLAADSGATALSTEFFCLEQRSNELKKNKLPVISRLAGINYEKFYRSGSVGSGYLRLNRNIKRPFVNEMEQTCQESGIRFYVSDAHFKERCNNGSCCGLTEDWNYSRGQFCEALVLCRANGKVTWPEVAEDMGHLKTFLYRQAQGYNNVSCENRATFYTHTMFDYLHYLWNNPKAGQSPYKMFEGVMKPTSKDENGDLIYELDECKL